ncbi:MAG: AraC family transcriptional regulator [Spirochaetaceae bacterium]|nr:MAG: AraC family transcriptional regulator [Spirochaetaceae bacterium]
MHNPIKPDRESAPEEPFLVRTHGLIDRVTLHSTPGTKDGDVMMTVFLAGRGTYRNADGSTEVEAGMIGIVPPQDPGILLADQNDPYQHYYCRFRGTYATHLAHEIIAREGTRFFRSTHTQTLAACLRRMGPTRNGPLSCRMGSRELLLAEALILLGPRDVEQHRALSAAALSAYLQEHVASPTSLPEIAAHFAVSVPTLCRHAPAMLGMTVQQYHEQERLAWACRLLRETTLRVGEVAIRVGYSDPLYFTRVFTRAFKCSPRTWRKLEG